jgi:Bacterial Ig domain
MPTLRTLLLASATATAVAVPASAAGPIRLDMPKGCVPVGGSITVALKAGKSSKIKAVTFSVDGHRAATDATAPFRGTLSADGLAPQTLHEIRARVTLAGPYGKSTKKSVRAVFATCAAA